MTASGLVSRTWSFRPSPGLTHDFALALTFSEEINLGSRVANVVPPPRLRM